MIYTKIFSSRGRALCQASAEAKNEVSITALKILQRDLVIWQAKKQACVLWFKLAGSSAPCSYLLNLLPQWDGERKFKKVDHMGWDKDSLIGWKRKRIIMTKRCTKKWHTMQLLTTCQLMPLPDSKQHPTNSSFNMTSHGVGCPIWVSFSGSVPSLLHVHTSAPLLAGHH